MFWEVPLFYILSSTWNWQTLIFSNLVVACFNSNSQFPKTLIVFLSFLAFRLFLLWIAYSFLDHFSIVFELFICRNLYHIMPENSLIYVLQVFSLGLWLASSLFFSIFLKYSFKLCVVSFIQLFFVICNLYVLRKKFLPLDHKHILPQISSKTFFIFCFSLLGFYVSWNLIMDMVWGWDLVLLLCFPLMDS